MCGCVQLVKLRRERIDRECVCVCVCLTRTMLVSAATSIINVQFDVCIYFDLELH